MTGFQALWWTAAAIIFAAAFHWGAGPERKAAAGLLLAYLCEPFLLWLKVPGLELGVFLVDLALLAGGLALAWSCRRYWVLVAAANQILVVLAHLTPLMDDTIYLRAAMTSRWAFAFIVLLSLGAGVGESRLARADPRRDTDGEALS